MRDPFELASDHDVLKMVRRGLRDEERGAGSLDRSVASRQRNPRLGALEALLPEFEERDAVLGIVGKLVAENSTMAQRLARIAARFKTSEKISRAQLVLFADALRRGEGEPELEDDTALEPDELDTADERLRTVAGLDDKDAALAKLRTGRPPQQPHSRSAAPSHLKRVDNLIAVPADQRACPTCGAERTCIGHDVSEVIDLIPAQVIVRRDLREKRACTPCEGELVRAPVGEKVVPSGKLGLALVAALLVEKYVDGLPLHRQCERYQRLGLDVSVSTLADQVKWCTDLLRPLWRAALAVVIGARVMHLDGTGLPVLDPNVPGGKRLGALWGYVGVNAAETIAAYLYVSTGKAVGQHDSEMGPRTSSVCAKDSPSPMGRTSSTPASSAPSSSSADAICTAAAIS